MKTYVFANDISKDIKYIQANDSAEAWEMLLREITDAAHFWYETQAED